MTISEKKEFLKEYTRSMARVQRLNFELERHHEATLIIEPEIEQCISTAESIEALIHAIPNGLQREIMLRRFIYGETLEEIGEALCYSPRHLQRIITKAVDRLNVEAITQ
ncbi:MAG: sigma-70 family RNA polymerase sigma factor [Clostridia bacterium]|nr:sigma-70 family RNA polymerase sigma factor [Clostridia bacterium]